jgi:serine/threonine protein kinase
VIRRELFDDRVSGWNSTKKSICIFGLAAALRYLHSRELVHRNVKLTNVLLNKNFEPFLCDCQLSEISEDTINRILGFHFRARFHRVPNVSSARYHDPRFIWPQSFFRHNTTATARVLLTFMRMVFV